MKRFDQHTQSLIDKYLHGKATKEEFNQLNTWYHSFDDTEVELQDLSYKDMEELKQSMLSDIERTTEGFHVKSYKSKILSFAWKVAATVVIIIGLSLYFAETQTPKLLEIVIITKHTDPGHKKTLTLSDGSIVKLNAGSSVSFPKQFGSDSREVKLIGEAFFQIAKDANRPFKVKTGDVTTIALGTSFNINAYPDSKNIDISLAIGKVRIEYADTPKMTIGSLYLEPGEKATYTLSTQEVRKQAFVPIEILGWKDDIIYFKNADETTLFVKLERWYGVEIELLNDTQKIIDITTKFENATLDNVLKSLGYTMGFEFSIHDKKVEINYLEKNKSATI